MEDLGKTKQIIRTCIHWLGAHDAQGFIAQVDLRLARMKRLGMRTITCVSDICDPHSLKFNRATAREVRDWLIQLTPAVACLRQQGAHLFELLLHHACAMRASRAKITSDELIDDRQYEIGHEDHCSQFGYAMSEMGATPKGHMRAVHVRHIGKGGGESALYCSLHESLSLCYFLHL